MNSKIHPLLLKYNESKLSKLNRQKDNLTMKDKKAKLILKTIKTKGSQFIVSKAKTAKA